MKYNIKKYREKRNMSKGELCRQAGITRQYLIDLEKEDCTRNMSVAVLIKLADALSVKPASLLS